MLFLIEGETQPFEWWESTLNASNQEITSLLQKKILTPVRKGLALSFVGEVVSQNEYIICLPKCVSNNKASRKHLQDITKAIIKKYIEKNNKTSAINEEELYDLTIIDDNASKEYEVFLSLSQYFATNGSYKRQTLTTRSNLYKRTYWKKTIQSTMAFTTDESIFYPDPISKSVTREANIVTDIFNSTLLYLSEKYSTTQNIHYLFDSRSNNIPYKKITNNAAFYCKKIQSELNQTFNTEDLNILSILMKYIDGELQIGGNNIIAAKGTSAFHVIWEDICAFVFRNEYQEEIQNFSQPKWLIPEENGSSSLIEKGALRPDVLWSEDNTGFILDAKYYYPFPESSCGVGDIAKQYIYAEASNKQQIINCFLFPSNLNNTTIKYGGSVIMALPNNDLAPSFSNRMIHAVMVDFLKAADAYVNESHAGYREHLKNIIK